MASTVANVVPATVELKARESQAFQAIDVTAKHSVVWALASGGVGTIGADGVYVAPRRVFRAHKVTVVARIKDAAGNESAHGSASIEIDSARTWVPILGSAWVVLAVVLLGGLKWLWPTFCVQCGPPGLLISPPLVTLGPGQAQQFVANAPTTWTNTTNAAGLYLAPTTIQTEQLVTITATSRSDPQQTATGIVRLSPVGGMSIVPSGVTVKEGTSVDLAASISDVTQVTPRWLQPSVGEVTQDGHYTAPLSNTPQAVVVIAQARVTGNQPGDRPSDLIAGALISVVRATPSQCDEPGPPGATLWRYILFVAWMGAIGGLAHGMGSFATYVGNNDLKATWLWWYALRPVISAAVAVLVYLVFRAGLGAPDLGLETTECLKIGGFAGLIGLFAEPAMIKLRDVFDAVFTPRRDPRGDKAGTVAPPSTPPQIEGLDKNEIEASHDTLTISGKNFSSDCVVRIGSRVLTPGNRSSTSLQVNIASGDVAPSSDSQDLVVINHPPGGDVSQPVKIIVK